MGSSRGADAIEKSLPSFPFSPERVQAALARADHFAQFVWKLDMHDVIYISNLVRSSAERRCEESEMWTDCIDVQRIIPAKMPPYNKNEYEDSLFSILELFGNDFGHKHIIGDLLRDDICFSNEPTGEGYSAKSRNPSLVFEQLAVGLIHAPELFVLDED